MDRTRLKMLRVDIDKALAVIGAEYSIDIKMGNARFTDTGFTTKVTGEEISPQGVNKAREADWVLGVKLGMVKADWLGKVIAGGYKITGCDHSKRSRNIILTKGGKEYSGKAESVERSLTLPSQLQQGGKP